MPYDEQYFKSDDFQQLVKSYEASVESGEAIFLDADDMVDIADYYNMKNESERADIVIEEGLALYPNHVLLNVYMARKALVQEDVDLAETYAERIDDKDAPDYHYLKAEILIAQNRIDEADDYLRNYGKRVEADEYEDFVKDVANLYIDYAICDKAYEWMMRTKGDDSDDFKELMGRTLIGLGKYKDSEHIFNELVDHNPFSKHYWIALATAQFMNEDYNAAITSAEYAIAIDPNDPDSLLAKANGLLKLTNYEKALEFFTRFSQVCPDDASGPLYQAACLVNLGRNQEAIPLLQSALTMDVDSNETKAQIYQELALAYSAIGELDRALDAIEQSESFGLEHADILAIKGHLLLNHKRVDEAEEYFKQALTESNSNQQIVMRIVASLCDNRYVKAAYHMLKHFLEMQNDDIITIGYSYMALCCWELHNDQEFLHYLQQAINRNPNEVKMVLGFIFPEDLPIEQYYDYMQEKLKSEK